MNSHNENHESLSLPLLLLNKTSHPHKRNVTGGIVFHVILNICNRKLELESEKQPK